jgi:hypothetical protein
VTKVRIVRAWGVDQILEKEVTEKGVISFFGILTISSIQSFSASIKKRHCSKETAVARRGCGRADVIKNLTHLKHAEHSHKKPRQGKQNFDVC